MGGKGRDSKHHLDHFLLPPKLGEFGGEERYSIIIIIMLTKLPLILF
jgi:hypothetical protein